MVTPPQAGQACGPNPGARIIVAQLAVVGAAVAYAFAGIFGRRFQGTPPLVTAAGQLSASALIMLPLVVAVDRPAGLAAPAIATWGALFGLSLLSTAVAYVIYFRILARAGATNLLLVTFLVPVSALLLAIALLGETLGIRQVSGMVLIGLGLTAIDGRPMAAVKRRAVTMGGKPRGQAFFNGTRSKARYEHDP